jgi:hypothetical protein
MKKRHMVGEMAQTDESETPRKLATLSEDQLWKHLMKVMFDKS